MSHVLFPEADVTLWVDCGLVPILDPAQLAETYLADHDLCTFRHSRRDCAYAEAEACIRMDKDDPEVIRRQMLRYHRVGYPYHNGLAETGALLRRRKDLVNVFNETWCEAIDKGSVRDQLSFDFCCWNLGLRYSVFPGKVTDGRPNFQWRRA